LKNIYKKKGENIRKRWEERASQTPLDRLNIISLSMVLQTRRTNIKKLATPETLNSSPIKKFIIS
jgi:hypothetical protein